MSRSVEQGKGRGQYLAGRLSCNFRDGLRERGVEPNLLCLREGIQEEGGEGARGPSRARGECLSRAHLLSIRSGGE